MSDSSASAPPPRTLTWAFWAIVAQGTLSVVGALANWGFGDYLREQLVKSNNKAKKPKSPYGLTQQNHDLHSYLIATLLQAAILGVLLVLIAHMARTGKSWARWAILLASVLLARAPFQVLSAFSSGPAGLRTISTLVGLSAIAGIVLMFLPESARYFSANRVPGGGLFGSRAAAGSAGGSVATGDRPIGLRALFAPRPAAAPRPARSTQSAPPAPQSSSGKADLTKSPAPAKSKARASASPNGASPAATRPASTRPAAAKSRGKSKGR